MNLTKQKSNVCLPGDRVEEKEFLPINMSVGNYTLREPVGNVQAETDFCTSAYTKY